MRANVHNVMSDAFAAIGLPERMFHVEFGPSPDPGVWILLITYNVHTFTRGLVVPLNQCLIKISNVDGQYMPYLDGNDLFAHGRLGRLMEHILDNQIDLGNT